MNERTDHTAVLARVLAVALLLCGPGSALAGTAIPGLSGTTFDLTAGAANIDTPDGDSLRIWGYGETGEVAQYPGPTLIVNEGDTVTITLRNSLPRATSIVFPGQTGVSTSGGDADGLLAREVNPGGTPVVYTFEASEPGTYLYHSGSQAELQIEMGLVGALIVRPSGFDQDDDNDRTAYGHADSRYTHEHLYLLTEMDPEVHKRVEFGFIDTVDNTTYRSVLWFINGRNAPDTLMADEVPWMPHQPYSAVTRMHPGDRVLMRVIGAGRELHPWHHHGNHTLQIARDGRLLQSEPGAGADLGVENFTIQIHPGGTYDAIFEWTGRDLGWDVYGDADNHPEAAVECGEPGADTNGDGFHDTTWEWCADHGKPFPVILPELQDMTFGGFYSGSPFLGGCGYLPPGEGGLNPTCGFVFMWHSHTEKELVNNDVFPGGMFTMVVIEHPRESIP